MFHRKLSNWFHERKAAGIAAMIIAAKDPIAILPQFHSHINDDVIESFVSHSYSLAKEGDHETALLWSDVAHRAALIAGTAKALADCLDWRASLAHKLFEKAEDKQTWLTSGGDARLKEALDYAHKALNIYREAGLDENLPPAHGHISVLYADAGERVSALEYRLLSAIGWAKLFDADDAMPALMANTHKLLSDLHKNDLKQGGELVMKNSTALLEFTRHLNGKSRGDVCGVLGEACRILERESEAIRWWMQAIDDYRGVADKKSEFKTWWRLQEYAFKLGDAEKIVGYGKACLASTPDGITAGQIGSRYRLTAFGHKVLEQPAEAISMFHRAADLFRTEQKSSDIVGECCLEAGILEEESGLIAEAERDFEEVLRCAGGSHTYWLALLKLTTLLWKRKGDLGAAARNADQAIEMSASCGFPVRIPALQLSALIHLQAGNFEKAFTRSVELLNLLDEVDEPLVTVNISPISWHTIAIPKKWDAAFIAATAAFQLNRKEVGMHYLALHKSFVENSDTEAISIEEVTAEEAGIQDLEVATRLLNEANHLLVSDPGEAIVRLERCLKLMGDFNAGLIAINRNLGIAHLSLKELEPARRAFQLALNLLAESPDIAEEIICRLNLGLTEGRDGNFPAAYDQFSRLVELKERQRASLTDEEHRLMFVQNETTTYTMLTVTCLELQYFDEALETIEKIKSRVMLDLMSEGRKPIDYPSLRKIKELTDNREAFLRERLMESYDSFRQRLDALMETDPTGATNWLRTSINFADEITSIKEDLRRGGLLGELESSSVSLSFEEIRDLCKIPEGDRRIVLVEYFMIDNIILVFGVREDFDKPQVVQIPMPPDVVRDFTSHKFQISESKTRVFAECQELFGRLIAPVEDWTTEGDIIWFVPHGFLHLLPLHALKLGDRYLIERNPVFYSSSASVQESCRKHRKGKHERALVLGDSLGDSSEKERLPFARAEARAIAGVFDTEPVLGSRATRQCLEQRLGEEAGEIDVLHIACHGKFSSDNPLKSGILLANPNTHESDSTILTAEEIFGLKLPVDLVTLSCCETGINENRSGDELIGLTRALIYAGAASVIASLWSVNDLSTRILMEHFYAELKAGHRKVDALQRAQLSVMKMTVDQMQEYLSLYRKRNVKLFDVAGEDCDLDGTAIIDHLYPQPSDPARLKELCFSDPFYWAPFILIGDWN